MKIDAVALVILSTLSIIRIERLERNLCLFFRASPKQPFAGVDPVLLIVIRKREYKLAKSVIIFNIHCNSPAPFFRLITANNK